MKIDPQSGAMTFVLASMTAIGPTTMDIYLASLPHIGSALNASNGQVQLTLSLYLVGFAIGQIFYGPLSDRFGRLPLLIAGFGCYLISTAACALAGSIDQLIVARIFQAVGAAGPIIVARATVRDLYSGAKAARQLGLMSVIQGVAPICAPIVGGFLQQGFGWRSTFFALLAVAGVQLVIALAFMPETHPRHQSASLSGKPGIVSGFRTVSTSPVFLTYVAVNCLSYGAVFAFLSGISHVLQDNYRFSAAQFGLTYAFCSGAYILGNGIGSMLVARLRLEGMLKLGSAIALLAAALQASAYALWPGQFLSIIIPQMVMMLGVALMVPQVIAAAMTPFPDHAGSASSMMGFTQMIGASATGMIVGGLLGTNAWPMLAISCAYTVTIFALLTLTRPMRTMARAVSEMPGAA